MMLESYDKNKAFRGKLRYWAHKKAMSSTNKWAPQNGLRNTNLEVGPFPVNIVEMLQQLGITVSSNQHLQEGMIKCEGKTFQIIPVGEVLRSSTKELEKKLEVDISAVILLGEISNLAELRLTSIKPSRKVYGVTEKEFGKFFAQVQHNLVEISSARRSMLYIRY